MSNYLNNIFYSSTCREIKFESCQNEIILFGANHCIPKFKINQKEMRTTLPSSRVFPFVYMYIFRYYTNVFWCGLLISYFHKFHPLSSLFFIFFIDRFELSSHYISYWKLFWQISLQQLIRIFCTPSKNTKRQCYVWKKRSLVFLVTFTEARLQDYKTLQDKNQITRPCFSRLKTANRHVLSLLNRNGFFVSYLLSMSTMWSKIIL